MNTEYAFNWFGVIKMVFAVWTLWTVLEIRSKLAEMRFEQSVANDELRAEIDRLSIPRSPGPIARILNEP